MGSIVHEQIAGALAASRKDPASYQPPQPDREKIESIVEGYIEAAERKMYLTDPAKYPPVFETYYGDGIDDIDSTIDKAFQCVSNFSNDYLNEHLKNLWPSGALELVHIDNGGSNRTIYFDLPSGVKMCVVPDLVLKYQGQYYVFDFKTGKPGLGEPLQASAYGLYAAHVLKAEADRIFVRWMYLTGNESQTFSFDEQGLMDRQQVIEEGYQKMIALHEDGVVGNEDAFEKRTDSCRFCSFREVCEAF